jgi:hypothetical protein
MRVILEVGIHSHHNIALGRPETGVEGCCLACVPSEANNPYPRIMRGGFFQDREAAIPTSVIHEDDLKGLFYPL